MGYYEEIRLKSSAYETSLSFEEIKKIVLKTIGITPFKADNGGKNINLLEPPVSKIVMTEEDVFPFIEDAIRKTLSDSEEIKGFIIPDDLIVMFIREKENGKNQNQIILDVGLDYKEWRKIKELVEFIDKTIDGDTFEIVFMGDETHYGYRRKNNKKYSLQPCMEEIEIK